MKWGERKSRDGSFGEEERGRGEGEKVGIEVGVGMEDWVGMEGVVKRREKLER